MENEKNRFRRQKDFIDRDLKDKRKAADSVVGEQIEVPEEQVQAVVAQPGATSDE